MEEPHFIDESTLVRARRVVPLRRLPSPGTHFRGWLLGGAFVLALILGAATALVTVQLTKNRVDTSAEARERTDTALPVETPTSQISPAENVASLATSEGTSESLTGTIKTEDPPKPVTPHKKSTILLTSKLTLPETETSDTSQPLLAVRGEEEQMPPDRQPTPYEQWQERRERRAARHERRLRGIYGSRDLFRIDEIFEGARRRPQ